MLSLGRPALRDEVIQRQLSDAIVKGDAETAETKARILAQYAEDPTDALDILYDAYSTVEGLHALGEYNDERFAASANAAQVSLNALKSSLIPKQSRFTARICVGPASGGNDFTSAIMAAMFLAAGHQATDLSRSTTPKELLRNAEQNSAEFLVVSFAPEMIGLIQEFAREYEAGGFRNKFHAIAFIRGSPPTETGQSPFVFVARDPLELLSRTTEILIRNRMSVRKESSGNAG